VQTIELPDPYFRPITLGFSADGRLLAVWAWGRACVIDTAGGTVRGTFGEKYSGLTEVPGAGFTADGRAVIVHNHSAKPPVRAYDLASGAVLRPGPAKCRTMEVGPGGRLIYLAHELEPSGVEIVRWDPLTGATLPPFARHKGYLRLLAVSGDEKWVAGGSGDEIRVWNLEGSKLPVRATRQFSLPGPITLFGLAISADGAFVAYNPQGVSVGNVRTGEMWKVSDRGAEYSREVSFHPARPVLAFSGGSAEVALSDVVARTELKRYSWGIGEVLATAFSPDGLRCAAASLDKVVIWDVDV
jgi:WD40 repeat protein